MFVHLKQIFEIGKVFWTQTVFKIKRSAAKSYLIWMSYLKKFEFELHSFLFQIFTFIQFKKKNLNSVSDSEALFLVQNLFVIKIQQTSLD